MIVLGNGQVLVNGMTRKYNRRLVICIDLDKTLLSYEKGKNTPRGSFGEPLPGAREFLAELHKFGDIVIHTCRTSPSVVATGVASWLLRNEVKDYLNKNGFIYDDIWCQEGKPNGDIFIDDKGLRIKENPSPEDYKNTLLQVKEIFGIE